jgi:hypothetical protein
MGTKQEILELLIRSIKQGDGIEQTNKDLGELGGLVDSVGGDLTSALVDWAGKYMSVAGAATLAVTFMKASMDAAAESEQIHALLDATLQSTGRSAEISAGQIEKYAVAVASMSTFDDDAIAEAATAFLRLENLDPSNMERVLKTVADFAAGTRSEYKPAADALADALETGRTRALGFDRELQQQISDLYATGRAGEGVILIMDQMGLRYGGSAAAALDTYSGRVEQLRVHWGELLETFGGAHLDDGQGIIYYLDAIVTNMDSFVQSMQSRNKPKWWEWILPQVGIMHESFNLISSYFGLFKDGTQDVDENTQAMIDQESAVRMCMVADYALVEAQEELAVSAASVAAGVKGELANAWDDQTTKLADLNAKLAEAVSKYGENSSQAADLRGQIDDLSESVEELTARFIYNQVVSQMDAETQLEAARALGILSEADYATARAVEYLTDQFDENNDGIVDSTESAGGYTAKLALVREAIDYLRANNQPISQQYILDYIETHYTTTVSGSLAIPKGVSRGGGDSGRIDRASGGQVIAGTLYNVNEFGRAEMFRPSMSGEVIPLGYGQGGGGAGMQVVVNYSPTISFADESELRNVLLPLIADGVREVQRGTES